MSMGDHLEELRRVVVRCLVMVTVFGVAAFFFKESVFGIIMAPLKPDFITFSGLREMLAMFGATLDVVSTTQVIATDISSQFMAHLSMSLYIGLLLASPYIGYQLLGYVLPALYENEKRYASRLSLSIYSLFIAGLLISYFVMFPVSCHFLATYSVSPQVTTMVDISSYLTLFMTLSLMLALVFQLPVVIWLLSKAGIVNSVMLRSHRKHCFVAILITAAMITPPDAMSMLLVALPLYLLFEVSILVSSRVYKKSNVNALTSAID